MASPESVAAVGEVAMVVPANSAPMGTVLLNRTNEQPSNVTRIFKLPPGYVLFKTASGALIAKVAPDTKGSAEGGVPTPPRYISFAVPAVSSSDSRTSPRSQEAIVLSSESAQPFATNTVSTEEPPSPRILSVRTVASPLGKGSGPSLQRQKPLLPCSDNQEPLASSRASTGMRSPPRIITLKSVATPQSKEPKPLLKSQDPVMQYTESRGPPVSNTVSTGVHSNRRILSVQKISTPSSKESGLLLIKREPEVVHSESQQPAVADQVSSDTRPTPRIITLKSFTASSSRESRPSLKSQESVKEAEKQETLNIVEQSTSPTAFRSADTSSSENPKPKPKPWSREPRPLWRSNEPVVLYSGCPPENLIEPKKKKDLPPESLPCPKKLDDILPQGFKYHISSFEELKNPDNFKAEIRINISKKEDALQWLQEFEDISGTNFRVAKTFMENSSRIIFKKVWKCQRNTHRKDQILKRESKRHIGCEARLIITVKNVEMKSSTDLLLSEFPCVVGVYHNHCHSTTTPDSLRFRRPLPDVRAKFADMFRAKITPATARRVHMADLKRQYGDKYSEVVQDGARCPPLPWCYRLYYETIGKKVKDGKKKSNRKSSYRRKVVPQQGTSSQILQEDPPVIINFNSRNNNVNDTHVTGRPACDEMQRSINSLYEYEFMSKTNEGKEHDLVESVVVVKTNEDGVELVENSEMISHDADSSEMITNSELLDNVEADGDFVEDDAFLNNDESVDEFVSLPDHPQEDQNNDETVTVTVTNMPDLENTSETRYSAKEIERVAERFQHVMDDIKVRLQNMPETYLPIVEKFLSACGEAQQTDSDSTLTTALSEFGSDLSKVMNQKPSSLEHEVTNIVEGIMDQNHLSSSVTHNKPQLSGSPRRKVLVLRMNPNKFNQIIGKVGASKPSKELINI